MEMEIQNQMQLNRLGNVKHSNVFYVASRGESGVEFIPIKHARPYKNEYGLDLFEVTRDCFRENGKPLCSAGSVSEGKTGMKMFDAGRKQPFETLIAEHGVDYLYQLIDGAVNRGGLSPRYTRPDEKKADIFPQEAKPEKQSAVLLKPMFVDGKFNAAEKRMRAKHLKTVSCEDASYELYISASETPERDYPEAEDDKYYLHVLLNGWLIPLSATEHYIRKTCALKAADLQLYGSEEARQAFYKELRSGLSYEEANKKVNEQIQKENAIALQLQKDDKLLFDFVRDSLASRVDRYTEYKQTGSGWPDLIGAAVLNDLDNGVALMNGYKQKRDELEKQRQLEIQEQNRLKAEKEAAEHEHDLAEAEKVLRTGGTIVSGAILCDIADKYGVKIPLRTRGWILNTFSKCTYDGNTFTVWYRQKNKNSGSTKIYNILWAIQDAMKKADAA